MLPVALLVTYTTFGSIAQDATSLYVADKGSVVRVDKNDSSKRTTLTFPTSRRIAAIDVDGDRVLYGTAPAPDCKAVPTFPPQTIYVHYLCSLVDADVEHEVRSASIFGGDDQLLFHMPQGVTEIAHDAEWIYWLSPSSGIAPASATLMRKNKITNSPETIAEGLVVSAINQHPFVLSDDSIYFIDNNRLKRVAKSGGATTDIVAINADSSIAIIDDILYYVDFARVYALDTRSGAITPLRYPVYQTAGATYPIAILGGAPGIVVASEGAGWTHTAFRGWAASDLCAFNATLLGSVTGTSFEAYFIPPLAEPPIAVDSNGIYVSDKRVTTFATPPVGCPRRRVVPR